MLIAFDTSGSHCSVGFYDLSTEKVVATSSVDLGRGHAEHLMPMTEALLLEQHLNWQDITKVGCTTGPGSFTGLRVGIASARALALALNCPCVGVSVFQALRFAHNKGSIAVVQNARRDELWVQCFSGDELAPAGEAVVCAIDDVFEHIPADIADLVGSGAEMAYRQKPDVLKVRDNKGVVEPHFLAMACAQADSGKKPKPLYLRKPDAKPQPQVFLAS